MSFRGREFTPGQSSLPPGTQLNGTYEIGDLINAGGMGEVYRGRNIATGDEVAIKVVLPEYAADQLILDLFRKEARILFQIAHEAIVRYYGFATDRQLNRSYMAMEFVEGQSLAERMRSGPLSVQEVSGLRSRVADGLQKAHDLGIIHRDISPENVILQGEQVSRAKIIDFGIAKSTALSSTEGTLIGTSFAGRYNFASPEQVGMFRPATVSPKSDIYSFGLVLAAALLGQPIDMSGTMAEIMEKRMALPDLSGIPAAMRELLTAMLQSNPANRIGSMAEVRDWPVATGAEAPAARATVKAPPPPPRLSGSKRPVQLRQPSKKPLKPVAPRRDDFDDDQQGGRAGTWIAIAAVFTVLAGAAGGWFYVKNRVNQLDPPTTKVVVSTTDAGQTSPAGDKSSKTVTPPEVKVEGPPPDTGTGSKDATTEAQDSGVTGMRLTPPAAGDLAAVLKYIGELTNFVSKYPGGDCFLAWPETISSDEVWISGYAPNETAFDGFLTDFATASGLSESKITISVKKVSQQQCEAINTISKLARGRTPKPTLDITEMTVAIGDAIKGSVNSIDKRHVDLLFVDEKGGTYKITSADTKLFDGTNLNIPMNQKKPPGSQTPLPQLVIAVSSPTPLESLAAVNLKAAVAAADLFPKLFNEAVASGQVSIALKYIKLVVPGD